MNIGLIDADLINKNSRFPNLALMKISAYNKEINNEVKLLHNYNNINDFDKVYISKVFDYTEIPINLTEYKNMK